MMPRETLYGDYGRPSFRHVQGLPGFGRITPAQRLSIRKLVDELRVLKPSSALFWEATHVHDNPRTSSIKASQVIASLQRAIGTARRDLRG